MALNVGELQATLGINTKGFTQGIDSARKEIDGFSDSLGIDIQQGADKASNAMDDVSESSKEMAKTVEDAGKKVKDAGDKTAQAGNEIETSGKKALTAKDYFDKFKSALSMVGIGVGIGTLVTKIEEVITKLKEAYDMSEKAGASFERSLGTTANVNAEAYRSYINDLISGTTYSEQEIANVVAKVIKTNRGASSDQITELSKQYLALGEMGFGGLTSNIDAAYKVFDRWGVATEDQTQKLSLFMDICRNTNTDMTELLSALSKTDYISVKLGMSIDDMATAVGNAGGNFDDLETFMGRAELMYNQMYDEVSTANPDMASEQVDETVRAMWDEAMKSAESIPEAERGKFWATFFGAESTSKVFNELAKGFSLVSNTGTSFSSGTSPYALLDSTRTADEKSAIASKLYEYNNMINSNAFNMANEWISKNADGILYTWKQTGTLEDGILSATEDIRDTVDNQYLQPNIYLEINGSDDRYTVQQKQYQSAVANVSNPSLR